MQIFGICTEKIVSYAAGLRWLRRPGRVEEKWTYIATIIEYMFFY